MTLGGKQHLCPRPSSTVFLLCAGCRASADIALERIFDDETVLRRPVEPAGILTRPSTITEPDFIALTRLPGNQFRRGRAGHEHGRDEEIGAPAEQLHHIAGRKQCTHTAGAATG